MKKPIVIDLNKVREGARQFAELLGGARKLVEVIQEVFVPEEPETPQEIAPKGPPDIRVVPK